MKTDHQRERERRASCYPPCHLAPSQDHSPIGQASFQLLTPHFLSTAGNDRSHLPSREPKLILTIASSSLSDPLLPLSMYSKSTVVLLLLALVFSRSLLGLCGGGSFLSYTSTPSVCVGLTLVWSVLGLWEWMIECEGSPGDLYPQYFPPSLSASVLPRGRLQWSRNEAYQNLPEWYSQFSGAVVSGEELWWERERRLPGTQNMGTYIMSYTYMLTTIKRLE